MPDSVWCNYDNFSDAQQKLEMLIRHLRQREMSERLLLCVGSDQQACLEYISSLHCDHHNNVHCT